MNTKATTIIKKFPNTKGVFDHAQCVIYAKRNRLSHIPTEMEIMIINYTLSDLELILGVPSELILSKTRKAVLVQARILFFYMMKTKTNLIDSQISCFLGKEHAFARTAKNEHNWRLTTNFNRYVETLQELIALMNEKVDSGPRRFIANDQFRNNSIDEMQQEMNLFRRFAKTLGHIHIDHKIKEFLEIITKEQKGTFEILSFKI